MNKDKLKKLITYKQLIEARQQSATPAKQEHRESQYRAFLANELRIVTSAIESAKQ